MKIILNREDIEEAIQTYVRDKFMSYGDDRSVNVTQGTKAMATITLGDKTAQLPGLEDEPEDELPNTIDAENLGNTAEYLDDHGFTAPTNAPGTPEAPLPIAEEKPAPVFPV